MASLLLSGGDMWVFSEDGLTWAYYDYGDQPLNGVNWNRWTSVTYGDGKLVAVADSGSGGRVMVSTDMGQTWTQHGVSNGVLDQSWESVSDGGGRFVAVSREGDDRMMASTKYVFLCKECVTFLVLPFLVLCVAFLCFIW